MSFLGSGKTATSAGKLTSTLKNLGSKITGTMKKSEDAPSGAPGLARDEVSLSTKRAGSKPGFSLSEGAIKHIQDTEKLLRDGLPPGGVRDLNLKHLKQKEIDILNANGRKSEAKALEKMSIADYDARFKAKAPTDSIVPGDALPRAAATSAQATDAGISSARVEEAHLPGESTPDITAGLKAMQTQVQARFDAPDVVANAAKQEKLNKNGALLEQQIEMAAALQEQGKTLEANKLVRMGLKDFEAHLTQLANQGLPTLSVSPVKAAESQGNSTHLAMRLPPRPPRTDLIRKDALAASTRGNANQLADQPPPLPPGKPKMNSKGHLPPGLPPRKQNSNPSLPVAAPQIKVASPDIAAGGPKLPTEASVAASTVKKPPALPPRPIVKKPSSASVEDSLRALEREPDAQQNRASAGASTRGLFSQKDQAQLDKAVIAAKRTEAEATAAIREARQLMARQRKGEALLARPIMKSSAGEEDALQAELAALMAEASPKAAKVATASVSAPKAGKATTTTLPEQQAKLKQKQAELDAMKQQAARVQQIRGGLIQTQQAFASLNKHNNELLGGKIEKLNRLIQSSKTSAEQKAQLRKNVADLRTAQARNRDIHKDFLEAIQAQRYDAANVLQQNLRKNFESQKKQFFPEGQG